MNTLFMPKSFRFYYLMSLVVFLLLLSACKNYDPNKPIFSYNGKGPVYNHSRGYQLKSGHVTGARDVKAPTENASIDGSRNGTFINAMSLLEGKFDHMPAVSNFRRFSRDVINESWKSNAPFKTIVNRKIRDVSMNFSELKFCERGTYAELARVHNNAPASYRKAIQTGIAGCMAAKESDDYWNSNSKLLRQRYPDRCEKGTGVVGIFQLDASPREGNQSICMEQFSRWGVFNKVGCSGSSCPARSSDQIYNVSCGTYFMVSAWASSHAKNEKIGGCSYVVPDSDIQFGSRYAPGFVSCVKSLANQQIIHSIADSMSYDNSIGPQRGMYVRDENGEQQLMRTHDRNRDIKTKSHSQEFRDNTT